jgi:hypothetical protein
MAPRQQRREPWHDASRHIRGHGEVRDRAVAPYPTSTIYSGNSLGRLEADNHSTRNIFVVLLRVDRHLQWMRSGVSQYRWREPSDPTCVMAIGQPLLFVDGYCPAAAATANAS